VSVESWGPETPRARTARCRRGQTARADVRTIKRGAYIFSYIGARFKLWLKIDGAGM
jgi:hypothetical protein